MTATHLVRPTPLPAIKKLGFDDGWASFGPTFLNFGRPSIFVDSCFLPDAERLGLEPFATRPPRKPLPKVAMHASLLGTVLRLYLISSDNPVAHHQYVPALAGAFRTCSELIVLVGDSWQLSLGWSALWTCRIGRMSVIDVDHEQCNPDF